MIDITEEDRQAMVQVAYSTYPDYDFTPNKDIPEQWGYFKQTIAQYIQYLYERRD